MHTHINPEGEVLKRSTLKKPARNAGFSMIWVLVLVGAMLAAAMVLSPKMLQGKARQRAQGEEQVVTRMADAYRASVRKTLSIPGTNEWVAAVAAEMGWDDTRVRQVFPEFAQDAGSQRLMVIDPGFVPATGLGLLPWTQSPLGVDPLLGATPGTNSRVMILSSSRRDLGIPIVAGLIPSVLFSQLWDWVPVTGVSTVPLSALDPRWVKQDQHLHVAHVELASLFHKVTLRNLHFGVGGSVPVAVSNTIERYFLSGTTLEMYGATNSSVVRVRHTLDRDASFDFTETVQPIFWWSCDEPAGQPSVANRGSFGPVGAGVGQNGALTGAVGPRPPSQSYFGLTNNAVFLDGVDDYFDTGEAHLNALTEITLSVWIKPANLAPGGMQVFAGQRNVLAVGFWAGNRLKITTSNAGFAMVNYPHPANEWHHVAVTLDGTTARLYLDGLEVANYSSPHVGGNCGSSGFPFQIGGGGTFNGAPDEFHGNIDEVMIFNRALSASQILNLAQNLIQ